VVRFRPGAPRTGAPIAAVRILIDYRPALREATGVGIYLQQLVRALGALHGPFGAGAAPAGQGPTGRGKAPIELTLFSSSWKDRLEMAGLRDVKTVDRRVPVRVLNLAWHRLGWPPVELLARQSVDVAHSPHPLLLPARHAAQVVTIHDLDFLDHPERTRDEIRRDYPRLAGPHARRADRVVVSSQYTARRIEEVLRVPADRVSLCPGGAPDWPRRVREAERGYVLFVGTLEPRKNLAGLLHAYERLVIRRPDAPPLEIAGKATAESGPLLADLVRPPFHGRIRYGGYVAPERLKSLYEGALLLVIPSLEEGFGLQALEAMTLGIPIVAADRGSLPEVIGTAGLLVDPGDPDALSVAIERVIDDPGLRRALSEAGVARARAFTWSGTAERMLDAYRLAVDHRARRLEGAG
jgi:glycosyltransferase involved in cell wall biosynthesis